MSKISRKLLPHFKWVLSRLLKRSPGAKFYSLSTDYKQCRFIQKYIFGIPNAYRDKFSAQEKEEQRKKFLTKNTKFCIVLSHKSSAIFQYYELKTGYVTESLTQLKNFGQSFNTFNKKACIYLCSFTKQPNQHREKAFTKTSIAQKNSYMYQYGRINAVSICVLK